MSASRSHVSSKSAKERANEFVDFYEDNGHLFCKFCQKSVKYNMPRNSAYFAADFAREIAENAKACRRI